ncbi:unnamed protein product [Anisakis simplex]|uniref:Uncharacterized protein n=1 Tax=Anisakis simplex TaxID=6269 RepID=A0A0M3JC74_ANISI|nr:unnamed protein product [Anisakis simplex]
MVTMRINVLSEENLKVSSAYSDSRYEIDILRTNDFLLTVKSDFLLTVKSDHCHTSKGISDHFNSHVPLQKSSSTFSGDSSPLENDAYETETNESKLFVTQPSHEETTTNEEPKEIITGYPEETTQPTRRRFIYVTKRPRKSRN